MRVGLVYDQNVKERAAEKAALCVLVYSMTLELQRQGESKCGARIAECGMRQRWPKYECERGPFLGSPAVVFWENRKPHDRIKTQMWPRDLTGGRIRGCGSDF